MIQPERIQSLNNKAVRRGRYVVYWMQASQRAEYNHALEYAIGRANELNQPLIVYFGLTSSFPRANRRHYYFMLEGLKEVRQSLQQRGIGLVLENKSPEIGIINLAQDACLVVTDRGYLKIQKQWRRTAARNIACPLIQVESDVVVPVEITSFKEEYSAATIRKKIHRHLAKYLVPLRSRRLKNTSLNQTSSSFNIADIGQALNQLDIDQSVDKTDYYHGGTSWGKKLLRDFIHSKLSDYARSRNDPNIDGTSQLSAYLHFGQISPLFIALQIQKTKTPGKNEYLEQLIVRRELAINFVNYSNRYDSFAALPSWAKNTLLFHGRDPRPYLYSRCQLENAQTHDPYWNAAQTQMKITGYLHGYMRMYWGKKILEWTKTPQAAFQLALYLNDKYKLDGRDANGIAGIAWCFGKHDRPWPERKIFGKVRFMNESGLRRKFDADGYVAKIMRLNKSAE